MGSLLDTAEKGISALEDLTLETSKTEKQRQKRLKKNKNTTKYPRTVGKVQEVLRTCNRNTRRRRKRERNN